MYKKINGEDASYVSRAAPDDIWEEMDDDRFNLQDPQAIKDYALNPEQHQLVKNNLTVKVGTPEY